MSSYIHTLREDWLHTVLNQIHNDKLEHSSENSWELDRDHVDVWVCTLTLLYPCTATSCQGRSLEECYYGPLLMLVRTNEVMLCKWWHCVQSSMYTLSFKNLLCVYAWWGLGLVWANILIYASTHSCGCRMSSRYWICWVVELEYSWTIDSVYMAFDGGKVLITVICGKHVISVNGVNPCIDTHIWAFTWREEVQIPHMLPGSMIPEAHAYLYRHNAQAQCTVTYLSAMGGAGHGIGTCGTDIATPLSCIRWWEDCQKKGMWLYTGEDPCIVHLQVQGYIYIYI